MAQYTTTSLQVALSVVICGVIYLVTLVFYRLTLHPLAKYPGPFLAKVSNFYAVYHAYVGDMHLDIEKCHQKYGTFVRYAPNSLAVNSADGFHDIYGNGKKVRKGPGYQTHGPGNLIGVRDKKYFSRLKKVFGQGFSDAALREHEPKVLEQIDSFCEKVVDSDASEKSSTGWSTMKNMTLWCNYMTTDIITKVIFTTSWDLLATTKNRDVVDMLTKVVWYTGLGHQSKWVWKHKLGLVLFPKLVMSIFSLRNYTVAVINASKKAREDDPTIKDVFGQFMNAIDPETGKPLNGDSVRLNSATIIIAGSDTSSSALSATFFYLSRHPSAYAKVAQEVRSTFKNPSEIRAGATLNSLQYLRASINEAMRLSPVVSQPLWRETEEGGCSIAGEQIPGGTIVGSGIYSLHHDPIAFPDPYTYDIERWILPANPTDEELAVMKERNRHFAPFSTGPRQCLAKNFAIMELLLTMANVFLRMDFKNVDGKDSMVGEGGEAWNIQEGLGATAEVPWGRQRKDEFQLKSYFTSHMEGPMIVFKRRDLD